MKLTLRKNKPEIRDLDKEHKFTNWVEAYRWLRKVVYGIARDKGVREDLRADALQETAKAILERPDKVQEADDPEAYIKRIAHNKVIDQLRQAIFSKPKFSSLDDLEADSEWLRSDAPSVDDYVDIWTEVDHISPKSRQLVLDVYAYGYNQREAAKKADLPLTTSFELLKKETSKLRDALAKAWLDGKVTNTAGVPLQRATIDLRGLPGAQLKPQYSDLFGRFTFVLRKTGKYLLKAKKKSYEPHEEQVQVPPGVTIKEIQLLPLQGRRETPQPAGGMQ